jgi:hypothetical protein
MKSLYYLVLFAILLASCSSAPSADTIATSVAGTVAAQQPAKQEQVSTTVPQPTDMPTKTPRPSPTRTHVPTSTPKPEIGSYENPYPYGSPMSLENSTQEFKITLTDVKRSDEAWQMLYDVNQFNEPAPEGMEWIGTLIKIEYTKGPSGKVLELDRYFLNTVTKGSILEIPFYVSPQPEFDLKILPGGEGEGWIFGHVYVDDPKPMIVFAYSSGNPGFYMSLTP